MLRVAAYARVSTDKEDQINSLKNQLEYFESYIKAHSGWEYNGVYFDEGVTGTQTRKRAAFNRMIEDCGAGKIDLILTKEVSRFARNTVDTLRYTRMLKERGIGVIFINDNIDTREGDGEFRLSIMASVAQEESRKTSERVKWGQCRAMEKGVVFGNNSIFGFDIRDGALSINEEQARTVRLIFHKYTNEGKGVHIIARELYEEGIKPPKSSKPFWSTAMLLRLLRNEKYVGDLIQKKYVTSDYLTHKKVESDKGDRIFIPNHHEAIIDRELWERAQKQLAGRSAAALSGKKPSCRYWSSGKIVCGECGGGFVVRKSRKKSGEYVAWACHKRAAEGKRKMNADGWEIGCNMRMINDKSLLYCMRFLLEKLDVDMKKLADEIQSEINIYTTDTDTENIKNQIEEIEAKKLRMLDCYFSNQISVNEMDRLRKRYNCEEELLKSRLCLNGRAAENTVIGIGEDVIYSPSVYGELLDTITVYDDCITVRLKDLDTAFKISYSTHGYKENYTTVIENWEIEL